MNEPAWLLLEAELTQWHLAGLRCHFWWRDDDLIAATPELYKMHALAEQFVADVLVAIIPAQMSQTLARDTAGLHRFFFCQHGFAHQNHAAINQPNSEFGIERSQEVMAGELRLGWQSLQQQFANRLLPVLVPPWNRICANMLKELGEMGYTGLSRYGVANITTSDGVAQIDTHIDVVDWATAPRFGNDRESVLLASIVGELQKRREDPSIGNAPLGILTHHRAMDDRAWSFMQKLLLMTHEHSCVEWLSPRKLFGSAVKKGLVHAPLMDFRTRQTEVEATLRPGSRTLVVYQKAISAINPVDVALLQKKYLSQLKEFDYHGDYKYADIPLWVAHKAARAVQLDLDNKPPLSILDIGAGAGHFAAICNSLGHRCVGLDIENPFYEDLCHLLRVDRRHHRVEPQKNLPDLGERFDLVTIMFQSFDVLSYNADGSRDYFNVDDWAFLFQDLIKHVLKPHGQIYLELNKKKFKDGSLAFDNELLQWCVQEDATVDHIKGVIHFSELC